MGAIVVVVVEVVEVVDGRGMISVETDGPLQAAARRAIASIIVVFTL